MSREQISTRRFLAKGGTLLASPQHFGPEDDLAVVEQMRVAVATTLMKWKEQPRPPWEAMRITVILEEVKRTEER
jgi:hypothetical protein